MEDANGVGARVLEKLLAQPQVLDWQLKRLREEVTRRFNMERNRLLLDGVTVPETSGYSLTQLQEEARRRLPPGPDYHHLHVEDLGNGWAQAYRGGGPEGVPFEIGAPGPAAPAARSGESVGRRILEQLGYATDHAFPWRVTHGVPMGAKLGAPLPVAALRIVPARPIN